MDLQAISPEAIRQMNTEVQVALIAAVVAVVVALISLIAQVTVWFLDKRAQRRDELLEKRRAALLSALETIDHVYAKTSFDNSPPANPHKWSIDLARGAMNGMIVFCKNPTKAVAAFSKAIGLHNPTAGPAEPHPFFRRAPGLSQAAIGN